MTPEPCPASGAAWRRWRGVLCAGAVWAIAVVAGSAALTSYQTAPGIAAEAPTHWPDGTRLARGAGRHTLVMMLHPRCPCSHASLDALERLLARLDSPPLVHLLFVAPPGVDGDWDQTALWTRATRIPNVHVVRDDAGREAARFHSATSGQTVLYDAGGNLVFAGGLTPSRGHAGDSAGWDAVRAALVNAAPARPETPVFGCPLLDAHPPTDRPDAL